MFLCSIFALSCRKARPSETWRSPYLISMSNILWERSCSGRGLGSWSWLPRTFARLAKTGSVANARQSLLSSSGCCTVKILGCLSLVSWPTPLFIISHINSLSPFSNLRKSFKCYHSLICYWSNLSSRARSRTNTEAACLVDFFTALYTWRQIRGNIGEKFTFHKSPGPALAMWAVTSKSLKHVKCETFPLDIWSFHLVTGFPGKTPDMIFPVL